MAITLNVNNSLKTPTAITVNVNGTLHNVTGVWCNAGGTLKFVWPGVHTAYNGQTFSGALQGGFVSGIVTKYYGRADYIGGGDEIINSQHPLYHIYFDGRVENYSLTSGTMDIELNDYSANGDLENLGYKTKNMVDLGPYKTIKITYQHLDHKYAGAHYPTMYLTFLNSNQSDVKYTQCKGTSDYEASYTYTFDVSSINDSRYICIVMAMRTDSTNNNYRKYNKGKITKIDFE